MALMHYSNAISSIFFQAVMLKKCVEFSNFVFLRFMLTISFLELRQWKTYFFLAIKQYCTIASNFLLNCELNCLYLGHLESLQFLISTLNVDLTSSLDYQNILHVACQAQRTPDHLVKYCIDMARSALSWDMVNHQDIQVQCFSINF